jgi:hypothetical protein
VAMVESAELRPNSPGRPRHGKLQKYGNQRGSAGGIYTQIYPQHASHTNPENQASGGNGGLKSRSVCTRAFSHFS